MTSGFIALSSVNGLPAGAATKISHGSQEWCGHVYEQVVFTDARKMRRQLHSYFGGEADQDETSSWPGSGVPGDAVLLWARGLAGPRLEPGASITVPTMPGLQDLRFDHKPLRWGQAKLTRGMQPMNIDVPAGTFSVEVFTFAVEGGHTWTIHVEHARPQRIIAWSRSDGQRAELRGIKRIRYWQLSSNGKESMLAEIGLKAPATP